MSEIKREDIVKKQRTFMTLYINFKAEIQLTRTRLKVFCSKPELSEMIEMIGEIERKLRETYVSLRKLTTPDQDIRRRMDTCTSVTAEITAMISARREEIDNPFDAAAVKESLSQLLQREVHGRFMDPLYPELDGTVIRGPFYQKKSGYCRSSGS